MRPGLLEDAWNVGMVDNQDQWYHNMQSVGGGQASQYMDRKDLG